MTDHLPDAQVSPEQLAEVIADLENDVPPDRAYALKIARHYKALRDHGGIEFLFKWMRTPNPMLGNISPEQMIKLGRGHALIQFIHDAQEDFEALPKYEREPPHCPTCECEPGSWGATIKELRERCERMEKALKIIEDDGDDQSSRVSRECLSGSELGTRR